MCRNARVWYVHARATLVTCWLNVNVESSDTPETYERTQKLSTSRKNSQRIIRSSQSCSAAAAAAEAEPLSATDEWMNGRTSDDVTEADARGSLAGNYPH